MSTITKRRGFGSHSFGTIVVVAAAMTLIWACNDSSPTSPGSSRTSEPASGPSPEACFSLQPDDDVFSAGQMIGLDAGCSANTTPATTYSWDFGDGRNGNGAHVEARYPRAGDYVVRLEVTNANGSSTATRRLRINPRPRACFVWDQIPGSPPAPCTVRFDATCTSGSISKYTWFFEGGQFPPVSLPDVTMTTEEPTIVYSWGEDEECFSFRPFERLVRLTVTDESGLVHSHEEKVSFIYPFLKN